MVCASSMTPMGYTMDEVMPSADWATAMRERFSDDFLRLNTAGELTVDESACLQQAAGETPQNVYRLMISAPEAPMAELAGYFVITQGDNKRQRIFFFSPVSGIEVFASSPALRQALEQRLADPVARMKLLHFVPVEVRASLASAQALKLRRVLIESPVFAARQQSIVDLRVHNLELIQQRLAGLPSLRDVLNAELKQALDVEFQGLDLSPLTTVVNRYEASVEAGLERRLLSSMSLGDAALRLLVEDVDAESYVREYRSPTVPYVQAQAQSLTLDTRMQMLLQAAVAALPGVMHEQIKQYWAMQTDGLSLRAMAAEVMADSFFNKLLQARHDGRLSLVQFEAFLWLFTMPPVAEGWAGKWKPARLLLLELDKARVELAGLFTVYVPVNGAEMYLFSEEVGLERFDSGAAVKAEILGRLKDPRSFNSLFNHVSLDQQPVLRAMYSVIVEVAVIDTELFAERVQSIIDKQLRDIAFRLQSLQGTGHDASAVVDHALDVRRLLDPRLAALGTLERWSTGLALERESSLALKQAPDIQQMGLIDAKLKSVRNQVALILRSCPDLRTFALEVLTVQFAAMGKSHLWPQQLIVKTYASYSLRKTQHHLREINLVDALLERVSECNPLPADGAYIRVWAQRSSPELKPVDSLDGATLLVILDRAAVGFAEHFIEHLNLFFLMGRGKVSVLSTSGELAQLRGSTLRYEVQIKHFNQRLDVLDIQLVSEVLERPERRGRRALNAFVPDVCEWALVLPDQPRAITLSNCFFITERGGTDPNNSGRVLLWSIAHGFERFESLNACKTALHQRLQAPAERWALFEGISSNDRENVLAALATQGLAPTVWAASVIESQWLEALQRRVVGHQVAEAALALEQATNHHFSASALFERVQGELLAPRAGLNLEGLLEEVRQPLFNSTLPEWLKHAGPEDQGDYAQLMLRLRLASSSGKTYSDEVPEMIEYAREQLTARLKADFPEANLDPDQIEVSVVQYSGPAGAEIAGQAAVSRLTHTLTYFSLTNFFNVQEGIRSYRALGEQPLPAQFDDQYVRGVFRALDLASRYHALLTDKLSAGHEGVIQRQGLFALQLPPQLLEYALQAKLKGELNETAYQYLRHVLNNPDAKAREPFNGVVLVARPLAFRAIEGRHADPALGMYLIGPASLDAGPQVLYVHYSKNYQLKTFASQGDFLTQLHNSPGLQARVLERLEPRVRKIYDHNGFYEPHIGYVDPTLSSPVEPNPPATLVADTLPGNVLDALYKDTVQLRLNDARAHSHTVAEADWSSLVHLLRRLIETALITLPGKLTWPLMLWQGEASLQASVEASADDRWGEALFDFANSLLMIAAARADLSRVAHAGPAGPALVEGPEPAIERLTPEQNSGLRPYAVNHLALADLQEDSASGLFTDPQTGYRYLPLDGLVFRVVPWRDRLRLFIGEETEGPLVTRDNLQRWTLDLNEPLLGGGIVGSRLTSALVIPFFNRSLNITAFGMRDIRRLYPEKARVIRLAHEQAIQYLSECQQHLQSLPTASHLEPATAAFLKSVFSLETINDDLLERLKNVNQRLLDFIQNPDYSPFDSRRYALGDLKHLNATALAGVHHPQKPIFFDEKFFIDRGQRFAPIIKSENGRVFDSNKHFSAATLIHEFTHLALDTFDINYVYSYWPFEELLLRGDVEAQTYRSLLRRHRGRQLTTDIQVETLFRHLETDGVTYTKIDPHIVSQLLSRTHLKSLEEVRLRFFNDANARTDIVLMNADSVTLVLTWLGHFRPRAEA